MTDYEMQPWYIRQYRWWRHMPLAMILGIFRICLWIITGMRKCDEFSRRTTVQLIWRGATARAEFRMGRTYSLEDVINEYSETAQDRLEKKIWESEKWNRIKKEIYAKMYGAKEE